MFRRRRFHRAKAHLVLSAMRHRAAEFGDRVTYVRADTYAEVLAQYDDVEVVHPTSYAALRLVERLGATVLSREASPPRARTSSAGPTAGREAAADGGLLPPRAARARRARRRRRAGRRAVELRPRQPAAPAQGRETLGVTEPWWPTEDDIDAEVREDLDRWEREGEVRIIGRDGARRFAPATRRRWPRWTTSSSTGCRSSGRTRTRSSRATRGWRTASSAPR